MPLSPLLFVSLIPGPGGGSARSCQTLARPDSAGVLSQERGNYVVRILRPNDSHSSRRRLRKSPNSFPSLASRRTTKSRLPLESGGRQAVQAGLCGLCGEQKTVYPAFPRVSGCAWGYLVPLTSEMWLNPISILISETYGVAEFTHAAVGPVYVSKAASSRTNKEPLCGCPAYARDRG